MNEKAKLIAALQELKDGTVKPDATASDEFGQYFAGSQRELNEPDTKIEIDLLTNLSNHYSGVGNDLDKFEGLLTKLKQEGKYKKFLTPPPGKIFRMMRIGVPTFVHLFNDILPDDWKKDPNKVHVMKKTGVLNPSYKSKIQSWTYSANEGLASFVTGSNQGEVLLIVVADSNQPNIFLNWQQMKSAINMMMVSTEKEAISFGPVKYMGLAYILYDKDSAYQSVTREGQFFSKNSERLIKEWKGEVNTLINELLQMVNGFKLNRDESIKLRNQVVLYASRLMNEVVSLEAPLSGNRIDKISHEKIDSILEIYKNFVTLMSELLYDAWSNGEMKEKIGPEIRDKLHNVIRIGLQKIWENEMMTRDKMIGRASPKKAMYTGQKIAGKEIK